MTRFRSLAAAYQRRRFAWLLFAQVLMIAGAPWLEELGVGSGIVLWFLALNLVAVIGSVGRDHGFRHLLLPTGLAIGVMALCGSLDGEAAQVGGLAAGAVVCVLAGSRILLYALKPGRVDAERICAALSVYLLLGILCAFLYSISAVLHPGALLAAHARPSATPRVRFDGALYFSFVTLATLGYGDIVPIGRPVRSLAIFEAVAGQLYLVVLVARMVSLHTAREMEEERRRHEP